MLSERVTPLNRRWLPLCLLSIACVLTLLPAHVQASDADSVQATLELSPRSCVPRNADAPCVERLLVRWRLNIAIPICVWLQGGSTPLFCVEQQHGERELQLPVRQSLLFELANATTRAPLAHAELLVLTSPAATKRRRYQHPWSVF